MTRQKLLHAALRKLYLLAASELYGPEWDEFETNVDAVQCEIDSLRARAEEAEHALVDAGRAHERTIAALMLARGAQPEWVRTEAPTVPELLTALGDAVARAEKAEAAIRRVVGLIGHWESTTADAIRYTARAPCLRGGDTIATAQAMTQSLRAALAGEPPEGESHA